MVPSKKARNVAAAICSCGARERGVVKGSCRREKAGGLISTMAHSSPGTGRGRRDGFTPFGKLGRGRVRSTREAPPAFSSYMVPPSALSSSSSSSSSRLYITRREQRCHPSFYFSFFFFFLKIGLGEGPCDGSWRGGALDDVEHWPSPATVHTRCDRLCCYRRMRAPVRRCRLGFARRLSKSIVVWSIRVYFSGEHRWATVGWRSWGAPVQELRASFLY